ncbi:MAG: hypothetical protein HY711_11135 [Candidatus Melainabacteria bacterium]|nr:hypothetical protein [Candidatus Melainabacteria bacterium]
MAQVRQSHSAICPYCLLGIKAGAPRAAVDSAYQRLIKNLNEENFMDSPQEWVQAQQAYMAIENAYRQIIEGDIDEVPVECQDGQAEAIPPKLGQMLIAAGIITLNELEEAIAAQKTLDLPLGEILKASSLITQMELDAFLLNQSQIRLPADSPYHIGQRLIGLGLVTEDMVRIALVEQRTSSKPLGRILVERGWLANDILKALVGDELPVDKEQL